MLFLFLALAAADLDRLLPSDPAAPGCAVDARQGGRTIAARAVGRANLETPAPITADTVFEIGSVSKQFIGAGLALLAERGKLSLDDPIRKWLPELPPLYQPVTIRMLANHTSGIRSWNNLAELSGVGEDSTGYDNAWVLRAVARQRRLNNAPGTEYLYSNSNFVLAAIIIERSSGKELNAFYANAFFERLGMNRSRWRTDFREIVPGRAQAYVPYDKGGWRLDMPLNGVAGAGGLLSTVGDLQKWNAALADPAPADHGWVRALEAPGMLTDGTKLRYGLGLELDPIAGVPAFSHAGSTGSYRAWLGRFPGQQLSVALLCNSGAVNTEDLGPKVAAPFLRAVEKPSVSAGKGAAPADLAGLYRNAANDAVVTAVIGDSGVRFNGGAAFRLYEGRLTSWDGQRRVDVARRADGRITEITISRIGNAPTRLVPAKAWSPSPRELRAFAGAYHSDEVPSVQRIVLRGDRLDWTDPSGAAYPLKAIYRDAFEAPDASWTLRFIRDRAGRVVQADFSITRARHIAFRREKP
jgi:CubicO group peptidase (beta-lactamase class C family)